MWSVKTQNIFADHFTYLYNHPDVKQITINPFQCTKFEGDFYGLLFDLRIPEQYHPFVLAFNKMSHPSDYRADVISILIPPLSELNLIMKVNNITVI